MGFKPYLQDKLVSFSTLTLFVWSYAVHNDLVRSTDRNQISLLVLLDLNATFDTVDHNILLTVFSSRFGIAGTAYDWFESYLSGRTQSFCYNGQDTDGFPINCSVPQGSVLGPVKFAAYTEDIVELVERHSVRVHLYDHCRPENVFEPLFVVLRGNVHCSSADQPGLWVGLLKR